MERDLTNVKTGFDLDGNVSSTLKTMLDDEFEELGKS